MQVGNFFLLLAKKELAAFHVLNRISSRRILIDYTGSPFVLVRHSIRDDELRRIVRESEESAIDTIPLSV